MSIYVIGIALGGAAIILMVHELLLKWQDVRRHRRLSSKLAKREAS